MGSFFCVYLLWLCINVVIEVVMVGVSWIEVVYEVGFVDLVYFMCIYWCMFGIEFLLVCFV